MFTEYIFGWFKKLPVCAKDMFMYIVCHIGNKTDIIEIREDKYCLEAEVGHKTFYSARRALLNRLIIPRTSRKNTYWVSPFWVYNGNRMSKLKKYAVMQNEHPFKKLDERIPVPPNIFDEPEAGYGLN